MKKQWIMTGIGTLFLAALLAAPDIALPAAREGISLFLETLLPSLLPYLMAGQLIAQPSFLAWCSHALHRIMPRLFHLPGASALALCISLASGYPAGARMTGELSRQGVLSPDAVQLTAKLASHAGPAFIIGSLGIAMLGDRRLGLLLWLCHVAAGLLSGMLWGCLRRTASESTTLPPTFGKTPAFTDMLLGILRTLALIGGTVVFFSVILALLKHLGIIDGLSRLLSPLLAFLGIAPELAPALLAGMLEMTTGCRLAIQSGASFIQLLPTLAFLLGFGGLSIHIQSFSLLPTVSPGSFIGYKMIQALTSMLLTRAALQLFPAAQPVFLPAPVCYAPLSFGQLAALAGYMLVVMLIFYLLMVLILRIARD